MYSVIRIFGAAMVIAPLTVTGALAQDVDAGQEAYVRFGCYTCHGYEGQGANTGPRLAPNPLPYEALANFVRQTSGDMPPFTPATLSDQELRDIYAYLESRAEAPDADDIPLLRNIE